ncbi:DUF4407 domain-containing protein [Mycolicibacterium fluoranthenivorans]|uniref:DUF4407 domain-containing protein n=1 Tax=Mycolicibacterium fluoranthenivorans TaxID=258505 RepID=A0A7X5TWZ2_9MYCO|nr:DUF4407 domain-containing protein [Mycolicibacterium fluoranthenivorans]MCV7356876.1 DUF4407 domain-containing protein [Mycolicibacterium fluoranthenivorans]NIH94269.1 hypothetical protein [Mycolicibacterium fluoranthenivorans]
MRAKRLPEPLSAAVLLLSSALAALVSALALAGATQWPAVASAAGGVAAGVLFGAVSWACAGGRSALAGRVAVAAAFGVVVGELAATVIFAGPIDRVLAAQVDSAPAVVRASAELDQARRARAGLDDAVATANTQRDEALVVARCEFNPSPQCPQVRITGVPGAGPETRTANEILADAQRQVDAAVADRSGRAAGLEADIAGREQALEAARRSGEVTGLGVRWSAMNGYTGTHPGPLVLRVLMDMFFVLLSVLPLILRRWRGATAAERGAQAAAERHRAELAADTAIAVKRAEVRSTIEEMWAEQELESARLAVAAQNEIDREQQRRRVEQALQAREQVRVVRPEPVFREIEPPVDVHLPVAAQDAAGIRALDGPESGNLPAVAEPQRSGGLAAIPVIPDVTKAAVRWIRPFVPPIVAGAIDNATKPLRQVFEETEEIHFTLRRTHKVTVQTEGAAEGPAESVESGWTDVPGIGRVRSRRGPELTDAEHHPELPGRRQLPPAR